MAKQAGLRTRRSFLRDSTAVVAGAALGVAPSAGRALGANDRIRMGFIGVGNRGSELLGLFMANPDVEVAALCDVYEPFLARDRSRVDPLILQGVGDKVPRMGESFTGNPARYKDFRQLLDRKDIDAVCIATPDHWHAIQTIMACQAGKDVYVEKPLTITIREGRRMVEVAAQTNRVVQVGLNRRGSLHYQELAQKVKGGGLGKVTVARACYVGRMYPAGIGHVAPSDPPAGLDWDLWLGPRAFRPFQSNIAPYKFRWWKDYSSQMGNWGVHYMDVIRWLMGEQAPVAISAHGGKYVLKDDRTIPDTMEVTFEFASGALVTFGVYEASGGSALPAGEIELRGTHATLHADQRGYKITPTPAGQFQDKALLAEKEERAGAPDEDSTANMIRDFLNNVKSRGTCRCPLEEGHRSTSFAHLANLALETRQRLEWDSAAERFSNSEKANQLLHYPYRRPWTLG
jgi:predicted dehydrogenase